MRHLFTKFTIICCLCTFAFGAQAQENTSLPELPAPIQDLVDKGAQIRYMGRDHGLDAWITIQRGQEQYFYVQPDGNSFVMGLLFNNKGKLITTDQVKRLQDQGDTLLDTLASNSTGFETSNKNNTSDHFNFKSPSERLFFDIENSNWIPLGQPGAPVAYSFIDPQCGHCHAMISALKEDILEKGRVQLRIIPVGFRDETKAQSAFLMATPNPQERLFAHLSGDENALPAKSDLNQQGVERNLAIMQSWKFNITPMTIYRAKDGSVKILRGRPKDIDFFLSDLGARS